MSSIPSDLTKLTVPQLKALCKERRITGYSKLSKAALLQKLAEVVAPKQAGQGTSVAAPSTISIHASVTANTANAEGLIGAAAVRDGKQTSRDPIASTQKVSSTKRLAHIDISTPPKRIRTSAASNVSKERSTPRSCVLQQTSPIDASVFKAPGLPARSRTPLQASASPLEEQSSGTGRHPTNIEPSTVRQLVRQTASSVFLGGTSEPTGTSNSKASTGGPSQTTLCPTTNLKTSSTKSHARATTSYPKRLRVGTSATSNAGHENPASRSPTFQQVQPVESAVYNVPGLPIGRITSFHQSLGNASTSAKEFPGISKPSTVSCPTIVGHGGRFRPLMTSRPKPEEPNQSNKEPSRAPVVSDTSSDIVGFALAFNVGATPLPVLSHISFPPKASERKWVSRLAIILSAVSPQDRQTCRLVSRTFRYAVYLSATHILSKNYPGRRLDIVFEQHPRNMTNFWPYIRFRTAEVAERRHAFGQSFLGRYTTAIGYEPLSERLWTSPDDGKQVDVALRFVLTRVWFAASVGAYGHDASMWSRCIIQDVREVVPGEIWQVGAWDKGTGKSCYYYVLEATCEVIGRPPSSEEPPQGEDTLGYPLRADWTAWVSQRSQASQDAGLCTLLEHVKWSNTEDYQRGISKAWLRRVQGQDVDGVAKRHVADRYVLASVVANGISGQWMSTSAMAQEFAGLPGKHAPDSRPAGRSMSTVNMYLAAHHHIESVHFKTAKGEALHTAIAVVQTPGREYYVLRDNGMQVGCEEEGIPEIWQQILGCDTLGRAR